MTNCNARELSTVMEKLKKRGFNNFYSISNATCTTFEDPQQLDLPEFQIPEDLYEALEHRLNAHVALSTKSRNYITCINSLSPRALNWNNYFILLKLCLYLEHYELILKEEATKINDQAIILCDKDFRIFQIPLLDFDKSDEEFKGQDFVSVQEVNSGNSSHGRIIYKGKNYMYVSMNSWFLRNFNANHKYNIWVPLADWPLKCCHYALYCAYQHDLRLTIFPSRNAHVHQPKRTLKWFNKNMEGNTEQQQAVVHILERTAYPAPYVVFGPPGTGKTATLAETICQIWFQDPSKRVLVCTPSNAAADEIAKRLLVYIPPNIILRMYARSKEWSETDPDIKSCTNIVGDTFDVLPKEIFTRKKIVLTTLLTSIRILSLNLQYDHFDYIFIDEASQATEPEVLLPLNMMVDKKQIDVGKLSGQLVIAGDPYQLGPVVQSKLAEHVLGKSFLERLLECEIYQKDEMGKFNPTYITRLVQNYRSHKDILHMSNKRFYDNKLIPCAGSIAEIALHWPYLPNPEFPLIFHAVHGKEKKLDNSHSAFNEKEISIVLKYLKVLIGKTLGKSSSRIIEEKDIGIVTPFSAQRQKIKEAVKNKKWKDISVGTVEIFQGQEKDVIILTTVRSQIFKTPDKHIGFLSNPKRFNVALTRAKSLLIIVGDPQVLQIDPCWADLIQYCKQNDAFIHSFTIEEAAAH